MSRLSLILLALLAITSMVAADPLYKWVDDQGNIHYSDKPQPGAQKIEMPKAHTFTAPQVATPPDGRDTPSKQPANQGYTEIAIVSPADQEVLWNTTSVEVSVSLVPGLRGGDSVTITVDGNSQTVSATSATFDDLDRGEHTITASVTTRRGAVLNAKSVTFYIQRSTKN